MSGIRWPTNKQYKMQISLFKESDSNKPDITFTYFEEDKYQVFNYDKTDLEKLASIDENRYDNNF